MKTLDNKKIFLCAEIDFNSQLFNFISIKFLGDFESFGEFREFYSKHIFLIVSNKESLTWKSIICSCYNFVKHKKCVHIYLYLQKTKKFDLINLTLLKNKNLPGRPKTVKPNTGLNKNIV
jgi:hypothetical protein